MMWLEPKMPISLVFDPCSVVIPTFGVRDTDRTDPGDLAAMWSWHVIVVLGFGYWRWVLAGYQALAAQVLLAEAASHLRCSLSFASLVLRPWCVDNSMMDCGGIGETYHNE